MATDTVEQVKARLSIVDVVSGYVKLERAGSAYKARCPFHAERTPSFVVSPERGTYHCFGCGVGGDIFSFVEAIEGVDFKGALKMLAERAGVPLVYAKGEKREDTDRLREIMEVASIFYAQVLDDAHPARAYLHERGIADQVIKTFRIGYAPNEWHELTEYLKRKTFSEKEILDAGLGKRGEKGVYDRFRGRIMFPIADPAGRIIAFSGRVYPPQKTGGEDAPKYINSPETPLYKKSQSLYGYDRAKQTIRKHNFAILVEGQMDLIAVHQAGWGNAVAVSGTAFTEEHAAMLKRMTEHLVISLDADEAGFKAAARAARAALARGLHVKIAQLPPGLDPADLILRDGEDAWRKVVREAKDVITFLLDVLAERFPQPDRFRRAAEATVLPFVREVQSPIERETYVREIAHRLHVSEVAVGEALAQIPTPDTAQHIRNEPQVRASTGENNRILHAAGILLWQESLKVPHMDVEQLAADIEDAIGTSELERIRKFPERQLEALRLLAESHYGGGTLRSAIDMTLNVIRRDRLNAEIAEVSQELQKAEARGDTAKEQELHARHKMLTGKIAKISGGV